MADFATDAAIIAASNEKPTDGPGAPETEGDNKFQKAISAWRSRSRVLQVTCRSADLFLEIDLTSMIPSLDNTASEIVDYQRDSTVQRKDLAQKTKDFRKLDDSAKLGEIKGLLKGK